MILVEVLIDEESIVGRSKVIQIGKFYSISDLDLLVCLSILPDLIDCFSGKASLSA